MQKVEQVTEEKLENLAKRFLNHEEKEKGKKEKRVNMIKTSSHQELGYFLIFVRYYCIGNFFFLNNCKYREKKKDDHRQSCMMKRLEERGREYFFFLIPFY